MSIIPLFQNASDQSLGIAMLAQRIADAFRLRSFSFSDSMRPPPRTFYKLFLGGWLIVAAPIAGAAQQESSANAGVDATQIIGMADAAIPIPDPPIALGSSDASAVASIVAFQNSTASSGWQQMQAIGTLIYGSSATPLSSTLTVLNSNCYRLDVQESSGTTSTRIVDTFGAISKSDGTTIAMPSMTAALSALSLPRLLALGSSGASYSVSDRGTLVVNGQTLHRVSMTVAFSDFTSLAGFDLGVTDFYFDPATNLVVKSAVAVQLSAEDPELYLRVTTYDDYRIDAGVLLPHKISLTLNGQPEWVLQLTSVNLQSEISPNYFIF